VIRKKLGFLRHAAVSPTNIHSKILVGVRHGIDGVFGNPNDWRHVARRRRNSSPFLADIPKGIARNTQ
jgi:hypothetical protein